MSITWISLPHPLRFLHGCDASYGALTLPPVGLSPTEHASLCWTHYSQNIRTRLAGGGYVPPIAGASACLPLHSHPYSVSIGMANAQGEGDGLETPAGIYYGNRRSGTRSEEH